MAQEEGFLLVSFLDPQQDCVRVPCQRSGNETRLLIYRRSNEHLSTYIQHISGWLLDTILNFEINQSELQVMVILIGRFKLPNQKMLKPDWLIFKIQ